MPDSFIDIAVWFTIVILMFNVLAMWVDVTTENPNLRIAGLGSGELVEFDTSDVATGVTIENVISDETTSTSTQRQERLTGQEGNILNFLGRLLFMWREVLYVVIPSNAQVIADMVSILIGIVQLTGLTALGMRLAQAIGALIPFT